MQAQDDDPQIGGVGDLESISDAYVDKYWTFLKNTFVDILHLTEEKALQAVVILKTRFDALDNEGRFFWLHQEPLQVATDYIGVERPFSPDLKKGYSRLANLNNTDMPPESSFIRAEPDAVWYFCGHLIFL